MRQMPVIAASGSATPSGDPTAAAREMWKAAQAVCFDVDSTVCVDEGIDELAAYLGAGEAVAAWTAKASPASFQPFLGDFFFWVNGSFKSRFPHNRQAMGGSVPFEEALDARLRLIQPTSSALARFLAERPPRLSPGIADLVAALQARGTAVYLVSGGFTQMIYPVAALLGIGRDRVFANTILFDSSGDYAGFDTAAFTSRSGGKAKAIEALKAQFGHSPLAMVGDGATDLEARRPGGADMFVGFGGIARRPVVEKSADWFVTSFQPLLDSL